MGGLPPDREDATPSPIPEPLRRSLPPHAQAVMSMLLGDAAPVLQFTVFDKHGGARCFPRSESWTPEQCAAVALAATSVHNPTARVLAYEVPNWPSPQVVVSVAQLTGHHRAVVLGVVGYGRYEVCEASLTDVVGTLAVDAVFTMGHPYGSVAVGCEVNGLALPRSAQLPADADLVLMALASPQGARAALTGAQLDAEPASLLHLPASTGQGHVGLRSVQPTSVGFGHRAETVHMPEGSSAADAGHVGLRPPATLPKVSNRKRPRPAVASLGSDAVVRPEIAATAVPDPTRMPFTVFDALAGRQVLFREDQWGDEDCLNEALLHTRVPGPVGRVLLFPHPGFATQQVLISHGDLLPTHRALVLSVQGKPEPEVIELAHGDNTLHALARSRRAEGWEIPVSCSCNAVRWPCDAPLHVTTETVHVWVGYALRDDNGRLRVVSADASGSWPSPAPLPGQARGRIDGRTVDDIRRHVLPAADTLSLLQMPCTSPRVKFAAGAVVEPAAVCASPPQIARDTPHQSGPSPSHPPSQGQTLHRRRQVLRAPLARLRSKTVPPCPLPFLTKSMTFVLSLVKATGRSTISLLRPSVLPSSRDAPPHMFYDMRSSRCLDLKSCSHRIEVRSFGEVWFLILSLLAGCRLLWMYRLRLPSLMAVLLLATAHADESAARVHASIQKGLCGCLV